jgi:hypothetical protein
MTCVVITCMLGRGAIISNTLLLLPWQQLDRDALRAGMLLLCA